MSAQPYRSEAAFESVIEAHLLDNGYVALTSGFDPERGHFPPGGH